MVKKGRKEINMNEGHREVPHHHIYVFALNNYIDIDT